MRGFAAVSVIVLHVIHHTNWTAFPTTGPLSWFRAGDLGVDLFFVISGFAIVHSAIPLLAQEGYLRFLATFSVRRLARIYPLYLLTLVAALFLVHRDLLSAPGGAMHIVSHLFMFHTFDLYWFSSINGVNWTIAIEMQFYLLVALILPLLIRSGGWPVLLAFVVIAWGWRWHAFHTVTDQADPLYFFKLFTLSVQLPGRLDVFAAGIALALLLRLSAFRKIAASPLFFPACSAMALALGYAFVFPGLNVWPSQEMAFVFHKTLIAASFGGLVLVACLIRAPWMIRATTPLRYLGTISYGLYLWHLPVLLLLKDRGLSPLFTCLLTLSVTMGLAAMSWHVLEKPMAALGRRWQVRARPLEPATT
nr:acyltransferase [Neoroseomonas terrae]